MSLGSQSLPRYGRKPGFSPLFSRIHLFSCLPQILVAVFVQSLSHIWFFVAPWTAAFQASLSFTISQSLLKLMYIESVMPSSHLILCPPLLLLPSIFPTIRVFSSESTLCIRWPKYWSFIFSISPSNEYSGLISFRIDWFDLLGAWPSNISPCASAQELVKCFQLLVRNFSLHVLLGSLIHLKLNLSAFLQTSSFFELCFLFLLKIPSSLDKTHFYPLLFGPFILPVTSPCHCLPSWGISQVLCLSLLLPTVANLIRLELNIFPIWFQVRLDQEKNVVAMRRFLDFQLQGMQLTGPRCWILKSITT